MTKIWTEEVVSHIFKPLVEKILVLLRDYHNHFLQKASSLAHHGKAHILVEEDFRIDFVTRDVLNQSIQILLDISLNEFTINFLCSSKVALEACYVNLEERVLEEIETFYETLRSEVHNPLFFNILSEKHSHHICDLMQNVTNRKIKLIRAKYATDQYALSFRERASGILKETDSTKITLPEKCPERQFVDLMTMKDRSGKGPNFDELRGLWKDLRTYKPV